MIERRTAQKNSKIRNVNGKTPGEWHREGGGRRVDGMSKVNVQERIIEYNTSILIRVEKTS